MGIRPEGPQFNSHAREGVGRGFSKVESAEGARRPRNGIEYTTEVPALRASKITNIYLNHALTGMAIKWRPFGPTMD